MSDTYISSIIGEISEDEYGSVTEPVSFPKIREVFGVNRTRPAIILIEKVFEDKIVSGQQIYELLRRNNFSEYMSVGVMRIFGTNQYVNDALEERGILEQMAYSRNFRGRMRLEFEGEFVVNARYARTSSIYVYPIKIIPEEIPPPPPPPEILYRSQATFTYTKGKKRVEMRIWYQSYERISEDLLNDMWNRAMDNANNLPNSNLGALLDELQEDPGFELNMEIEPDEVEGSLDTWYGKLIFVDKKSGARYEYSVL